jgi:hypothetical protein
VQTTSLPALSIKPGHSQRTNGHACEAATPSPISDRPGGVPASRASAICGPREPTQLAARRRTRGGYFPMHHATALWHLQRGGSRAPKGNKVRRNGVRLRLAFPISGIPVSLDFGYFFCLPARIPILRLIGTSHKQGLFWGPSRFDKQGEKRGRPEQFLAPFAIYTLMPSMPFPDCAESHVRVSVG